MKARAIGRAVVLLALLGTGRIWAQETELSYDIYDRAGALTVWVDAAPFLNSRAVDQLHEGIDLVFECQASVGIPRKLWGDRRIAHQTTTLLIRYRPVTEDFVLEMPSDSGRQSRPYISLAGLHQYLHDSVEIALAPLDSMSSRERYVLDLKIAVISLTDINIGADKDASEEQSDSPVKYLFRQFLDITGYGREEFEARSRPFAITELERIN